MMPRFQAGGSSGDDGATEEDPTDSPIGERTHSTRKQVLRAVSNLSDIEDCFGNSSDDEPQSKKLAGHEKFGESVDRSSERAHDARRASVVEFCIVHGAETLTWITITLRSAVKAFTRCLRRIISLDAEPYTEVSVPRASGGKEVPELHPLMQYMKEGKSVTTYLWSPKLWMKYLFGISKTEDQSIRRVGITASDSRIREIVRDLYTRNGVNADNDMATILRDTRVKWSFFDIFATQMDDADQLIIRFYSRGAKLLRMFINMVAEVTIFFASLHVTFTYEFTRSFNLPDIVAKGFDILYLVLSMISFFCVSRIPPNNVEVVNHKKLFQMAFCDWRFYLDVVSFLPMLSPEESTTRPTFLLDGGSYGGVYLFLLAKLTRVWRTWDYYCSNQNVDVEIVSSAVNSTIRMIYQLCLLGHVLGCVWFLNICYEGLNDPPRCLTASDELHPGVQQAYPSDADGVEDQVLYTLYTYSLKAGIYLLLGYDMLGEGPTENLWLALFTPIGAFLHAWIFSVIVMTWSRMNALDTKNIEESTSISQAMKTLKLPASLQLRIMAFNMYKRIHRSTGTFDVLFQGLPKQLNFELRLVVYYNLMSSVSIFKRSPTRMLRELVLVLEDKLFLPGDFVCRAGEDGKEMHFISKGKCIVMGDNLIDVYKILVKGEYFGEVSLFTGQKRTAFVKAEAYCTTASLHKNHFDDIMRQFPKQLEVIFSLMTDAQRSLIRTVATDVAKEREKNPIAISRNGSRRPSFSAHGEERRAVFARNNITGGRASTILELPSGQLGRFASPIPNSSGQSRGNLLTTRHARRSFTITLNVPEIGGNSPASALGSLPGKPNDGELASKDGPQGTGLSAATSAARSDVCASEATDMLHNVGSPVGMRQRSLRRSETTGLSEWQRRRKSSTLLAPTASLSSVSGSTVEVIGDVMRFSQDLDADHRVHAHAGNKDVPTSPLQRFSQAHMTGAAKQSVVALERTDTLSFGAVASLHSAEHYLGGGDEVLSEAPAPSTDAAQQEAATCGHLGALDAHDAGNMGRVSLMKNSVLRTTRGVANDGRLSARGGTPVRDNPSRGSTATHTEDTVAARLTRRGEEEEEEEVARQLRSIVRKMRAHVRQLVDLKANLASTAEVLNAAQNAADATTDDNDLTVGLEYLHQVVAATAEVMEWEAQLDSTTQPQDILAQTMDAVQNAAPKARPQSKMLARSNRGSKLADNISASTAVV